METVEAFSERFSGEAKAIFTQMIPEYQKGYIHYVYQTENPATQKRRIKYLTKCFLRLLKHPYFYIQPLAKERAQEVACWQYPKDDVLCDEKELARLFCATKDEHYFEVIHNGAFVGVCAFHPAEGETNLSFALCPDRLGQGLGSGFYQAVESYAREHYPTQTLCVYLTSSQPLQTFLEKRGYHRSLHCEDSHIKMIKNLRD